ncbi:MAG: hypothetical protein PVI41_03095 [Roseobacter sp.]|jgi:hypothetical protein
MTESFFAAFPLIAGMSAVIAAWLFLRSVARARAKRRQFEQAEPIIIDGSNIMHWNGGEPRLETVKAVVDRLTEDGFAPGVVFDANAGYLLSGKYQHDGSLSRWLGLPEKNVMVVPKGTPADPMILQAARDMDARVVTNDRYRDWVGQFPEIRRKGFLIRGSFASGELDLKL